MLCFTPSKQIYLYIKTFSLHGTDVSVAGALFADIPLVKSRLFFSVLLKITKNTNGQHAHWPAACTVCQTKKPVVCKKFKFLDTTLLNQRIRVDGVRLYTQ